MIRIDRAPASSSRVAQISSVPARSIHFETWHRMGLRGGAARRYRCERNGYDGTRRAACCAGDVGDTHGGCRPVSRTRHRETHRTRFTSSSSARCLALFDDMLARAPITIWILKPAGVRAAPTFDSVSPVMMPTFRTALPATRPELLEARWSLPCRNRADDDVDAASACTVIVPLARHAARGVDIIRTAIRDTFRYARASHAAPEAAISDPILSLPVHAPLRSRAKVCCTAFRFGSADAPPQLDAFKPCCTGEIDSRSHT